MKYTLDNLPAKLDAEAMCACEGASTEPAEMAPLRIGGVPYAIVMPLGGEYRARWLGWTEDEVVYAHGKTPRQAVDNLRGEKP